MAHKHYSDEYCDFCRPTDEEKRKEVFDTFDDAFGSIFYYDRKEDERLPVNAIQEVVESGIVTRNELVVFVAAQLGSALDG